MREHRINAILSIPRFHTSLHSHIFFPFFLAYKSFHDFNQKWSSRIKNERKDYIMWTSDEIHFIHIIQHFLWRWFHHINTFLFDFEHISVSLQKDWIHYVTIFPTIFLPLIRRTNEKKIHSFRGGIKFLSVWHTKNFHIATTRFVEKNKK